MGRPRLNTALESLTENDIKKMLASQLQKRELQRNRYHNNIEHRRMKALEYYHKHKEQHETSTN